MGNARCSLIETYGRGSRHHLLGFALDRASHCQLSVFRLAAAGNFDRDPQGHRAKLFCLARILSAIRTDLHPRGRARCYSSSHQLSQRRGLPLPHKDLTGTCAQSFSSVPEAPQSIARQSEVLQRSHGQLHYEYPSGQYRGRTWESWTVELESPAEWQDG